MNAFVDFFTKTVPAFAETNWLAIEITLLALVAVFVIVLCIVVAAKRKQKRESTAQIMDWVSKNTERINLIKQKDDELKELNDKYVQALADAKTLEEVSAERVENVRRELTEKMETAAQEHSASYAVIEKELTTAKEVLAEREMTLAALTQECQDKNEKIANMAIEKDNLEKELQTNQDLTITLRNQVEGLTTDFEELEAIATEAKADLEELEVELADMTNKYTAAENSFVLTSEKHAILEGKYNEALKEIDILKNFELENEILLKTLRKFREDDAIAQNETRGAIVELEARLNDKINTTFETMTARLVAAATKCDCNEELPVSEMKRSQLSKLAKEFGITNFATWSNEKLREEIRKHQA